MAKTKKKTGAGERTIATNRKARHDYTVEKTFEAGMALEGWEVKSLRAGRVNLKDSYVLLKQGAPWLIGMHVSPLNTASTHVSPDPMRTRKLLLHQKEIDQLIKAKEREGYTIVALDLHWTRNRAKASIALVKGKKQHDKRETEKKRDWDRQKHRILKSHN